MLADSPKDRGPSAPSLRMVIAVPGGATEAMQHAAQLLPLSVSLGRHAAEHNLLAVVVADLRREDLKGTHLVAAHRSHVTSVDAKGDRSRRRRWCRSWCRDRFPLQSGADVQASLADRLDHWRIAVEREELLQQPVCAAVWQP